MTWLTLIRFVLMVLSFASAGFAAGNGITVSGIYADEQSPSLWEQFLVAAPAFLTFISGLTAYRLPDWLPKGWLNFLDDVNWKEAKEAGLALYASWSDPDDPYKQRAAWLEIKDVAFYQFTRTKNPETNKKIAEHLGEISRLLHEEELAAEMLAVNAARRGV